MLALLIPLALAQPSPPSSSPPPPASSPAPMGPPPAPGPLAPGEALPSARPGVETGGSWTAVNVLVALVALGSLVGLGLDARKFRR